jgi:hypothetical protein
MSLLTIALGWQGAEDDSQALRADLEELEQDGMGDRLRAIARTLTPEEHQRLAAEAAAGDRLAELMVAVLATAGERVEVVRCRCGGIGWEPDGSGVRERCTDCGRWSPVSAGIEDASRDMDRPPAGATERSRR